MLKNSTRSGIYSRVLDTSFWKSEDEIKTKIAKIFENIEGNRNIQETILAARERLFFLPFKLYKKMAIWNKEASNRASKIVEVKFGLPIQLKPELKILSK